MGTPADSSPSTAIKRIVLSVDRDRSTGGLQVSVHELDPDDSGHGYRICGPKYMADSENLLSYDIDERDAAEITRYLSKVAGNGRQVQL